MPPLGDMHRNIQRTLGQLQGFALPHVYEPNPVTTTKYSFLSSITFVLQSYGKELAEAYDWLQKYMQSRKEAELHQAWDVYYHVFKRINKQLPTLTQLELQYVSPALARAEVTCFSLVTPISVPKACLYTQKSWSASKNTCQD